jgi:hypothetical protein
MPRHASNRDIICVECPDIYSEHQINAQRGDESKPLVEVLGKTKPGSRGDVGKPTRRTVRRLLGRESFSDGGETQRGDADTSTAQREKLKHLNRLKDWTFTCPKGHTVDGNRGYQIPLAVVGSSKSSKSHFLPGLIWETNLLRALSPLGVSLRQGQFTSSQLSYSVRQLYEQKKVLLPTPPTEVAGPFGYRLTIRDGNEDLRYSLLLFDVGGEALSTIARIGEQAAFVLLAQGLVVLIDPDQVVTTLFDGADAGVVDRQRVIAASKVRDSITLVADALEELWDCSMKEIPIPTCFVIAKADSLCWTYRWEEETVKVVQQVQGGGSLRKSLLESSERVEKAFSDFGGELIVEEIQERFAKNQVRFVASSATCEMPTEEGWENPTPKGVALSLLHILDMLGRIPANEPDVAESTKATPPADWSPDAS